MDLETLTTFEIGSWEDAATKDGKSHTTTKWIDRAKKDKEGPEFARCRFVARLEASARRPSRRLRTDAPARNQAGLVRTRSRNPQSQKKPRRTQGEAHVCGREEGALQRTMRHVLCVCVCVCVLVCVCW